MYNSGYLPYSNPYSSGAGGSGGGYDYSQPIPVASNAPAAGAPTDQRAAQAPAAGSDPEQQLNPAIDAFKTGDYDLSLRLVNQALQQTPGDAVMHEFRALVLFAKRDYKNAAATIHSVLAVGPGWDWTTLSSLYSDIGVYTKQFQALEQFVEEHPQDGAAHFLLGYHYLTCGHPDSAAGEFEQVVKLVPSDKVAADLFKMAAPPKAPEAQPPQPKSPRPSSKPVDPASLVGTWKAARDDGSKFELTLPQDSSFTWKYSQKQNTQEFSGTYSVEGNLLVLQRQDGTSMIGQITADGPKKFNFKIVGAPADDPGLNFAR
jgi:tetratricopeptide (TPR) repeat protein